MNNFNYIIGLFVALSLLYRGKIQGQNATERFLSTTPIVYTSRQNAQVNLRDPSRLAEYSRTPDLNLPHRADGQSRRLSTSHKMNQPPTVAVKLNEKNIGEDVKDNLNFENDKTSVKIHSSYEPVKLNEKNVGSNISPPKSDVENEKVNFETHKSSAKIPQSNSKGNVTIVETPLEGGNATTANGTVVTFDERNNFDIDACPEGLVRINGKCVPPDD